MRETILIVDDDESALKTYQRVLRDEPYTCLCFSSPLEALDAVARVEPAVVLSDQKMPGMDGTDFLSQIRQMRPLASRIIVTGISDINTAILSINKGQVFRFITKPWNDLWLKIEIRQALEYYHLNLRRQQLSESVLDEQTIYRERLKGVLEMAGAVCHELAQPLQVITGYCGLLMPSGKPDSPEQEYLTCIQQEVKRMEDLLLKIMAVGEYRTRAYLNERRIIDIDAASVNLPPYDLFRNTRQRDDSPPVQKEGSGENRRILVIDDDEGIRDTYLKILTAEDRSDVLAAGRDLFGGDVGPALPNPSYEVVLAESGLEGLEKVAEARRSDLPFAVAFIDMKMPGIDGAQTAGRIWEKDPEVKIVIVTAYSEYSPEEIILTAGKDDLFYLRKPFTREEILQFARALTHAWNLEKKRCLLEEELKQANLDLEEMNRNLEDKVKKQAAMMVQTEKMATVGLLAAGVAHEINNPISFVNSNLSVLKQYAKSMACLYDKFKEAEAHLEALGTPGARDLLQGFTAFKNAHRIDLIFSDLGDLVDESMEGVDRVKVIVQDLKAFSRMDEAQLRTADVNAVMENALKTIRHEFKYSISVEKKLSPLPGIRCYPQKLAQVFMNLLLNAAQAIEDKGRVSISTEAVTREGQGYVKIVISDTGCGIPRENLDKLFDPFFTTKPVGKGTGLGLSIVYEIVKSHQGTIRVESQPGQGTRFEILLPQDPDNKGLQ